MCLLGAGKLPSKRRCSLQPRIKARIVVQNICQDWPYGKTSRQRYSNEQFNIHFLLGESKNDVCLKIVRCVPIRSSRSDQPNKVLEINVIPGYSILQSYNKEVSISHYFGHISFAMQTGNARGRYLFSFLYRMYGFLAIKTSYSMDAIDFCKLGILDTHHYNSS